MIKQIRLVHCQSLDDVTFDFASDKVNVLCAENNTGKSILFKILKLIANPQGFTNEERAGLITWGNTNAFAIFAFDDEDVWIVCIFSTHVLYKHGDQVFNAPPPEFLDKVGLLTNNGFIANLIDTEQDLLLVNPKLKSNYELMSMLVHNAALETLRERVGDRLQETSKQEERLGFMARGIQNELNDLQYKNLDAMKRQEKNCRCVEQALYDIAIPCYEKATELEGLRIKKDFDKLKQVCSVCEKIEGIQFDDLKVRSFNKALLKFSDLLSEIAEINFDNLITTKDVSSLRRLGNLLVTISNINFDRVTTEKCNNHLFKYVDIAEKLRRIDFSKIMINKEAAVEIERLQEVLTTANAFYECPIKGKVIYDGEKCISYNK